MLCEKCHQREAVVKFTQVIGNEKTTLNLCKACAEKQGLGNPLIDISKVFGKIIIAILGEHITAQTDEDVKKMDEGTGCERCGLLWSDFKKTGRLGCPHCYDTYMEQLKVLLRRLHGSNKHIGKQIKKEKSVTPDSLNTLQKKLKKAIEREEYEVAAEMRDRIRELKRASHK